MAKKRKRLAGPVEERASERRYISEQLVRQYCKRPKAVLTHLDKTERALRKQLRDIYAGKLSHGYATVEETQADLATIADIQARLFDLKC